MPKILKTKKIVKKQNKALVWLSTVVKGLAVSAVCFLLLSLLIYKVNDTSFYYYAIFFCVSLGAFISGYISYQKLGGRGILCGFISAMILLLLFFVTILFVNRFNFTSRILLIIPICLVPGVLGGILSANK